MQGKALRGCRDIRLLVLVQLKRFGYGNETIRFLPGSHFGFDFI
jgi:hypothetical protein